MLRPLKAWGQTLMAISPDEINGVQQGSEPVCMSACVASILGTTLEALPLYASDAMKTYNRQLAIAFGVQFVPIPPPPSSYDGVWIAGHWTPARMRTLDASAAHAVVMRGRAVAWDPATGLSADRLPRLDLACQGLDEELRRVSREHELPQPSSERALELVRKEFAIGPEQERENWTVIDGYVLTPWSRDLLWNAFAPIWDGEGGG